MTEGRAFGWPRGSVRAALAFATVGTGMLLGVGLTLTLALRGQLTEAVAVFGTVIAVGNGAMQHYFGQGGSASERN